MSATYSALAVVQALRRAGAALQSESGRLNDLDQAMGDGDIGITLEKIGIALQEYASAATPSDVQDLGKWLGKAGMAANRAGSSSFGTLLSASIMQMGKVIAGKSEVSGEELAAMFTVAAQDVQNRGKANPGDKTVLDALIPAAEAFAAQIADGAGVDAAAQGALVAAEAGRDAVTPLRSKIGRAAWVGERTEGKVDPGCEAFVVILRALVGA